VPGSDAYLSVNPEFLREGYAWADFLHPDRVVVGAESIEAGEELARLYAPFGAPVIQLDPTTAEFVKHASNALLATLISFSNELAMAGQRIGGIDVQAAFRALHRDRRWSGSPAGMTSYLWPGSGFGGYCLPKDTAAMAFAAESHGANATLLRDVLLVNERVKADVVERVAAIAGPSMRIGILGLAFKPGTADVRGSPAIDVVKLLAARGFSRIVAFDPAAMDEARPFCPPDVTYAESLEQICQQADVLVVLTAWPDFRRIPALAAGKPVVDGRHFL
jgi:UDPglucose 6-dehydrogenase